MKPTIGRIVHFHAGDYKNEDIYGLPIPLETYAGIITAVQADGRVSLVTFGPHSIYHHNDVSFSEKPAGGCWSWPPREPVPTVTVP